MIAIERQPDFHAKVIEMLSLAYAFECENDFLERANDPGAEIPPLILFHDAPEIRRLRLCLRDSICEKLSASLPNIISYAPSEITGDVL